MKKPIFYLIFLMFFVQVLKAQKAIEVTYGGTFISFEDSSDYDYVLFDEPQIWTVTSQNKEILYLPENTPYNIAEKSFITDTSTYYTNNLNSFIQFKLVLNEADEYIFSFFQKYDFELNKDGGIIETSYDNGATWQNILFDSLIQNNPGELGNENLYSINDSIKSNSNEPGFTGIKDVLEKVYVSFTPEDREFGDTIFLRLTIISDNNQNNNEGWLVNNLSFSGIMKDDLVNKEYNKPSIYPNPIKNELNFVSNECLINIDILNIQGRIELRERGINVKVVDTSNLKKGIYFVQCYSETSRWTFKLCKI